MELKNILFLLSIVGALLKKIEGRKETIGEVFESSAVKQTGCLGVFLFEDMVLEDSAVHTISARVVRKLPVTFQVWRPMDKNIKLYKLVGQKHFEPRVVPSIYSISLFPDSYIIAKAGDVIGMYSEQDTCAVAYKFMPDPNNPVYHSSTTESMELGVMIRFTDVSMPYRFPINVSYDTDWEPYLTPFTGVVTSPQTPEMLTTIPPIPPNEGTFVFKGNPLNERTSIAFQGARGIFLLPHIILPDCVVVKFYAHFVRADNVWFQVWRPGRREGEYILIGQKMYKEEQAPSTAIVELNTGEHIFTKQGDILGFMIESDIGVIGYKFLTNPSESGPYAAAIPEDGVDQWSILRFNTNKMPYDYAVGVMCDTVIDSDLYGTPEPQPSSTPSPSTTTTSVYTLPTILPPNSLTKLIGEDYITIADKHLSTGAKRTFLLPDLCFEEYGIVLSFVAFFTNAGSVQFVVCRPMPNEGDGKYMIVGTADHISDDSMVLGRVDLHGDDRILVEPGDCIGFTNLDDIGIIGYKFEQARLYSSELTEFQPYDRATFDELPLPYKFSIGAVYNATDRPTTLSYVSTTTITTSTTTTPLKTALPTLIPSTSTSLVIGDSNLKYTDRYIQTGARRTFIIPELEFTEYGEVKSFAIFVVNPGDLQFQVWRQVSGRRKRQASGGNNAYTVVGKIDFRAVDAMALGRVDLVSDNEIIYVEPGDCVGFSTYDDRGLVGYSFEQTNLYSTANADFVSGTTIQLDDQLLMPYQFAIAAVYDKTDPPSSTTITTTQIPTTSSTTAPTTTTSFQETTSTMLPTSTLNSITTSTLSSATVTTSTSLPSTSESKTQPSSSPSSLTSSSSSSISSTITDKTQTSTKTTTPEITQSSSTAYSTLTHTPDSPSFNASLNLTTITTESMSTPSSTVSSKPSTLTPVTSSNTNSTMHSSTESSSTSTATRNTNGSTLTPTDASSSTSTVASTQPVSETTTKSGDPKTGASTEDGPYFWLQDPNFLLAMLVWLVVLTVLFLVMCCYLIFRKRNKNNLNRNASAKSNRYLYAYPTRGLGDTHKPKRVPSAYERWGGIKEEDTIDYFNPQIGLPQVARCDSVRQPYSGDLDINYDGPTRTNTQRSNAPLIDASPSISRAGTNKGTTPLIEIDSPGVRRAKKNGNVINHSGTSLERSDTTRSNAPLIDLESVTSSSTHM